MKLQEFNTKDGGEKVTVLTPILTKISSLSATNQLIARPQSTAFQVRFYKSTSKSTSTRPFPFFENAIPARHNYQFPGSKPSTRDKRNPRKFEPRTSTRGGAINKSKINTIASSAALLSVRPNLFIFN